jgi:hypothetical protein
MLFETYSTISYCSGGGGKSLKHIKKYDKLSKADVNKMYKINIYM